MINFIQFSLVLNKINAVIIYHKIKEITKSNEKLH